MKTCADWKEAISSRADGQNLDFDCTDSDIDEHVAICSDCASFAAFVPKLKRRGMREASAQPDLSRFITKSVQLNDGRSCWAVSRAVLATCALEILFFSFKDLFSSAHDSRHLGAFSASVGIAFLMVALRPTRARMMLPVTVILGLTLVLGAIFDVIGGRVPLLTEARHVPELISVWMIWLLAKPTRVAQAATSGKSPAWVPRVVSRSSKENKEIA